MNTEHPRRLALTTVIPVRWGDMDALGHVNNTVYFRYMEQARIEWLASLGYDTGGTEEGPVIANASCNFRIPLVYPADVEVRLYLGAAGRSSIPTYYELYVQGNEPLYADGAAMLVWISTATGKSVPLPEALRAEAASALA